MIRYSTLPAFLFTYLFIVKTCAGAHSLRAGKAENAPHIRIKRNQIVDIVSYCDKAVGINTTNKIYFAPVVNFTSGNSFC
jgi:hypothetical protein